MLELKNISKVFNKNSPDEKLALKELNLTINDGEFITVIGGNGSGKTTTLNIIAGTYSPDSGEIILDGKDISKLSEYKRAKYFARVFQDPKKGTAANMQIEENLAIANRRGKRRGLSWQINKEERNKFIELLKEFDLGLEDRLKSKVGALSGGQRQAVTLLMATLQKPKILLLDEHTAALDPKTAKKVLELTNKVVKEYNMTALMITHNMKDALTYGNRLIMYSHGKIVLDVKGEEKDKLTVEELYSKFNEAEDI